MKIVVNKSFGSFSLSKEAYEYLGLKWDGYGYLTNAELIPAPENGALYKGDAERTNPLLVECVETLGEKANGYYAELEVVEIPDGINWFIFWDDGYEIVEEEHRRW